MEIFKLMESTMANVKPGHSMKHLRRDQLLDNYEAAAKTLQTLMKAKESEIAHRKDLIRMLDQSRSFHDNRLAQAKQEYQVAKSHLPEGLDLKSVQVGRRSQDSTTSSGDRSSMSTTPPLPVPPPAWAMMSKLPPPPLGHPESGASIAPGTAVMPPVYQPPMLPLHAPPPPPLPPMSASGDNLDENRSSLDRRLSEFMRTFPGMAPVTGPPGLGPDPQQQHQQPMLPQQPQTHHHQQQPPPAYWLDHTSFQAPPRGH